MVATGSNNSSTQQLINTVSLGLDIFQSVFSATSSSSSSNNNKNNNSNNSSSGVPSVPNNNQQSSTTSWSTIGSSSTSASMGRSSTVNSFSSSSTAMSTTEKRDKIIEKTTEEIINDIVMGQLNSSSLKQKVAEVNKDANKIRNQIKNGDYKNEKELNELQNKLLELGALSQAYGQNISLAMQNEKKVEAYNKKFDSALDNNMSLNNYQDTMNSLEKSKSKEDKTSKTSNNDVLKAFANSNKELLSDMLEAMNNNVSNVKAYDNWKAKEIAFTDTLAYTDEATMVQGILNLNSSIQSYDDRYKTTSEELKKSNSRVEQFSNQIINKISENELTKVTTDVNSLVLLHDLRIENANGITEQNATINLAEGILNNQINSKGVLETVNALKEVNDSYKSKIDNGNYEGLLEKALCETFIDTNNITSLVYSENYVYIEKNEKKIEKLENKLTNVVNDGCKISDFNNYLELLNDDLKKTQNIIDDKENNIISLALAVNRNSKISGIKEAILDSKDEIKEYSKWKKAESKEYKEVKDNLAYDNVNNYINNNINEQNEYVNQFNNLKNENQKSSESNSLKEIVKDYYTSFIQEGILIGKSTTLYNNSESIKTLYNKQVEDIILNQQKIQTVGTIVTDNTVAVNTQETKVSYQDRIKELEEKNKQDQEKMSKITDSSARDGIQKQIDERNSQIAGLKYQEYCEQYSGLIDDEQRKINNLENMLNPNNYLPSSVRDERQKELGNSKNHLNELIAYQSPEVYAAALVLEDAKQKYESASKPLENSTGIPTSELEKLKNKQQQAAEEYNNATKNYNLTLAGTKYNNEKVNNIDLKNQLLNAQNMVTEGYGMTTDAVAYLKKQQEQKIADITKNISESNINLDKNRKEYNLLNNSFITDLADSSVTKKSDLENKIKELESQKSQITNVSAKNEIQKTIDAYKSQQSAEDKKIGAYYKLAEDLGDVTKLKSVLADKYNNSFDDKTEHRIYSNLYAAYLQDSIKNSRDAILDYISDPNYNDNTMRRLENNGILLENEFNSNFDPLTITTTYGALVKSLEYVPASERAAIQKEMDELKDKSLLLGFDVEKTYDNKVQFELQQAEEARLREEEESKNVVQKFFEGIGQGAKDFYNNWFQFGASLEQKTREAFKNAKTYDDIIKIAREQTGATLINAAGAAWTGIEKAAEGVIDLGVMAGAGYISSQFAAVESLTGTYGSQNSLSSLYMDNALKFIGTDWVGNANKKLYQTDFGRYLDEKSYIKSDSAAAGFIEGLGEVAGTIMIGGAVANPKVGMTLVAGGKGYSRGVETALVDGADLQSANIYGLLSGGREASEWLLGMKANQYFEGIMSAEGATSATIAKAFAGSVAFDTVDAASEGFVQPLLQLSYKNNDGIFSNGIDLKKFAEQYAKNFEQNGGMATVIEQALIGGMMSSVFSGKDAIGASKRMDASTSAIGMKLTDEGHQITSRDYDVSVIKQNPDGTYRIDIENNQELATFANMGRKLKESNIPNVDPSKIVDVNYRPADNVKVSEGTVKPDNANVRNIDSPTAKAYDTLLNEKLDVQTSKKISEIDNSIAEINKKLYTDDIDIPTELYLKKQLGELQLQKQNIEKGISDVSKYSISINADANAVAKAMDWDTMRFNREQSYVDGSKISIDANKTKINDAYFSDVDSAKTTPKTFAQKVKDTGAIVTDFVKNIPLTFIGKYAEADILPESQIYKKIKDEGLVHITTEKAATSIMKDGQLNAKNTLPIYHDYDRAYMFAGDPSYAGIAANVDAKEVLVGIKINPTDEQLSHLKYRHLNDNAVVNKGDFKFSPDQVEKVYYGLTRDINGNLCYAQINAEAAKNYHFDGNANVSSLEKIKMNNEMINKARLGLYAEAGAISTPDLVLRKLSDNIKSKVSNLFEVNTSPVKDIKINTKINTPDNAQKLAEPRVYVSDKPISKIDTNAQTSTPKIKGTDYESVMKHNTEFENLADKMSDMTPEELLAYRESTIKPENKPIIAELDAALSKNSDQTLKGVVEMSINKMLESGSPDAKIAAKALINLCDNPEFKGFHLVDSSAFDTRTGIVGLDAELVDSANIYVAAHELIHGFQNFSSVDGIVHLPDNHASIVANAKAHLESIGVASLFEDFGITFDKLREYTSSKYSDVMDQFEKQNLNILKEKVADSNITLDKYKQLKDGYKTILGDYYNDYSGDGMPKWKKVNTPSDLELTPDEFEYVMKQKESVVYKNSDVYDELVPDKYTYEFMKKNETTAKFILEDFEWDMKNSRSSFDYINQTMSNANLGTQDFAAVSEIITGVLGDPQKVKDLGADHLMGHSKEYYEARPTNAFEEASVEFARLKLFNRTDALEIIRFFVGDEYYNMLDTEYHRIINSDMKMTKPKSISEVASTNVKEPKLMGNKLMSSEVDGIINEGNTTTKIKGTDYESVIKHNTEFENLADKMSDMTPEELLAYRESTIKPENKPILDNLEDALTKHSERGGEINWQEKTLIGPVKQAMNEVLNANGSEGIKFVQKVIDLVNNPEFNGFESSRIREGSFYDNEYKHFALGAYTIDGNALQTMVHEINHAMQNFYYKNGVELPSDYDTIIKKTKEHLSNKNVKEFLSEYSQTSYKIFNDDMQKFSSTIKAMQENLNEQRKSENHLVSKEKYKSEYEDAKKFGIMDYTDPENPVLKKFNANDDLSLTPEQLEDFNKIKEEKIFKHSDAYDELNPDIITYLYMKNMVSYPLDYLYEKFDRLLTDVRKDGDYITQSRYRSISEDDFVAISEMISGIYGGTDTLMKKFELDVARGHDDAYYRRKPNNGFQEAYVEFARLKEMNRTEALGLVKELLGDDFYNMLDNEYNRVMNGIPDVSGGVIKADGIAANPEIHSNLSSPEVSFKNLEDIFEIDKNHGTSDSMIKDKVVESWKKELKENYGVDENCIQQYREKVSQIESYLNKGGSVSIFGQEVNLNSQLSSSQLQKINEMMETPAYKYTGIADFMRNETSPIISYILLEYGVINNDLAKLFNDLYDQTLIKEKNKPIINSQNAEIKDNIKINNTIDIEFDPIFKLDSTVSFDDAVKNLGNYFGDFGYDVAKLIINADYDINKVYSGVESRNMRNKFDNFLNNTKMGQFISKLTPQEVEAIIVYTSHEYDFINRRLYEGKELTPKYQQLVENLDSAIKKFGGLDADMTLYRGTTTDSFKGLNGEYEHLFENIKDKFDYRHSVGGVNQYYEDVYCALKNLEGKDIDNLGYTSTSPAYETSFAASGYDIVMEICAPKGTEGAYINQLSNAYNSENEILLTRGMKFHIDEVLEPALDASNRKRVVVKCTIVNDIDIPEISSQSMGIKKEKGHVEPKKTIEPLSAEGIF